MSHKEYSSERKAWSTSISNGLEELIKNTLPAQKIIYTEQNEQKEEIDPVRQVLDYSGIDAIAVTGIKSAHPLSLRATNWNRPQVTIRAAEVDQWSQEDVYLRPSFHVQFIQDKTGNTKHLVIVDLKEFRSLKNPLQYMDRITTKKNGYFYRFNAEGLKLDCVRIWNL